MALRGKNFRVKNLKFFNVFIEKLSNRRILHNKTNKWALQCLDPMMSAPGADFRATSYLQRATINACEKSFEILAHNELLQTRRNSKALISFHILLSWYFDAGYARTK
jgi:hypothetical protein